MGLGVLRRVSEFAQSSLSQTADIDRVCRSCTAEKVLRPFADCSQMIHSKAAFAEMHTHSTCAHRSTQSRLETGLQGLWIQTTTWDMHSRPSCLSLPSGPPFGLQMLPPASPLPAWLITEQYCLNFGCFAHFRPCLHICSRQVQYARGL